MAEEETLRRKAPAFRMWTPFVFVGLLSLCVSEGMVDSSAKTDIRLLQVQSVRSRHQCRRLCQDTVIPGGPSCNWSTVYRKRCLLLHCRSLHLCLNLKGSGISELLAGFKHFTKRKKRGSEAALYSKIRRDANENSTTLTSGTITTATTTSASTTEESKTTLQPVTEAPSTSSQPRPPSSTASGSPISLATTSAFLTPESTLVVTQTSVTTTQPSTTNINKTSPTAEATTLIKETAPLLTVEITLSNVTSSQLSIVPTSNTLQATLASSETLTTTEKPSLTLEQIVVTIKTNSTTKQPSPSRSTQAFSATTQPTVAPKSVGSTVIVVAHEDADRNVEVLDVTTPSPVATETNTAHHHSVKANDVSVGTNQLSKNETQSEDTSKHLLMNVTGEEIATASPAIATISEITSVIKSFGMTASLTATMVPTLPLLPTTTAPRTKVPTRPEEYLTTKKETTKTTLPSVQVTHSAGSTKHSAKSTDSSENGQNEPNDGKYLVATWPLARHLMDTSSLLAVLLFGIIFFLAVVFVFASQAYESYKKKDYTQVDYLINGMYTDSEL
ncbi:uncharacterized protein C11orf24 homolog [Ambystoma mexicanum]|uniref:uncharacterized protein C11orf24 homolog n=1 Tax=Ambystoma mexicanum TaxID=8296 RepID=UPI0037E99628